MENIFIIQCLVVNLKILRKLFASVCFMVKRKKKRDTQNKTKLQLETTQSQNSHHPKLKFSNFNKKTQP